MQDRTRDGRELPQIWCPVPRCRLCPEEDGCIYVGESARNLYTRGKEHIEKYKSKKRNIDSFIRVHQDEEHPGMPAD